MCGSFKDTSQGHRPERRIVIVCKAECLIKYARKHEDPGLLKTWTLDAVSRGLTENLAFRGGTFCLKTAVTSAITTSVKSLTEIIQLAEGIKSVEVVPCQFSVPKLGLKINPDIYIQTPKLKLFGGFLVLITTCYDPHQE